MAWFDLTLLVVCLLTPILLPKLVGVVVWARILRSLRFPKSTRTALESSAVHLFLEERATQAAGFFEPLGFANEGPHVTPAPPLLPLQIWMWRHEAAGTIAHLTSNPSLTDPGGAVWSFLTWLEDGTVIGTNSREPGLEFARPAHFLVEAQPGWALGPLWQRHKERVQEQVEARKTWPQKLGPGAGLAFLQRFDEEIWLALQGQKEALEECSPGLLRPRWVWILRQIPDRMRATNAAIAQAKAPPAPTSAETAPPLSPEAQIAFEIDQVQNEESMRQARRLSPRARLVVSAVTLLLFLGVMAWRNNLETAVLLSGALLFHELGHIVAMRLFGSRDTSLLFIPLLGGAAVQNDRPLIKPWQEVVILLAGPLPGILLGAGLLLVSMFQPAALPAWTAPLIPILLGLNLFNLLPISPLDGGQLVNTAIFSRLPRLGVVFKALSGVALAALAIYFHTYLLAMFGLIFILRLPTEWRMAKAVRELRAQAEAQKFESTEEQPWLRRIFRHFQTLPFHGTEKFRRGSEALRLAQLLRQPKAGLGTLALAVAGWGLPIWLLLAGLAASGIWEAASGGSGVVTMSVPAEPQDKPDPRLASIQPEENGAADYAMLARLEPNASLRPEHWQAVLRGSSRPYWVPGQKEMALPYQVTMQLGARFRHLLAAGDKAGASETVEVSHRILGQLLRSPRENAGLLRLALNEWLNAFELGLAELRQKDGWLPPEVAEAWSRHLLGESEVAAEVVPDFLQNTRAMTKAFGGLQATPAQSWSERFLRWMVSSSQKQMLAELQQVSREVEKQQGTPWSIRLGDGMGGFYWQQHQHEWAQLALRLDMARGALAWHAQGHGAGEATQTEQLSRAWFSGPAAHPLEGNRWRLVREGSEARLVWTPAKKGRDDGPRLRRLRWELTSVSRALKERRALAVDEDEEKATPPKK